MYPIAMPMDGDDSLPQIPQKPSQADGIPPIFRTPENLPPEVIEALKRMGYPVEEVPMSNSDRVEYAMPASSAQAAQVIVEPSQQLADNFSQMLASQPSVVEQPYIPYLGG